MTAMKTSQSEKGAILCCGEALIDMIPVPTSDGANTFVAHSGGAIFNTAISLGRLDVPVGMLTGLSTYLFGQQLRDDLSLSGVNCDHIALSDRPTTLAFVKLVAGHAEYSFYDENTAGRMLETADLHPLSENLSAMYFGGISLACEPGAETYATLCANNAHNHVVMIDPNIRPSFIEDEERYRARLSGMLRRADIVKVSDEDLDWISPGEPTTEEKAEALLDRGPSIVILTRGSKGATGYLSNDMQVNVTAPSADVVDTVGAGDTFNAGVLCRLQQCGLLTKANITKITEKELKDALTFGARVAAITVSRAGANPPWATEIAD